MKVQKWHLPCLQGDAMWNAIERGDLRRYRVALTSLRVKPSARQGTPPAVPLRIFVLPPDADQGMYFLMHRGLWLALVKHWYTLA